MANSYQRRMAKGNIDSWKRSSDFSLDSAYGRYSSNKASAWKYCEDLRDKHDGRNLKVISHNTYMFTAGFEYNDAETGEVMFMFITPSYDVSVSMI